MGKEGHCHAGRVGELPASTYPFLPEPHIPPPPPAVAHTHTQTHATFLTQHLDEHEQVLPDQSHLNVHAFDM